MWEWTIKEAERQRHYFANKARSSQSYSYKESWAAKNWCFWTVVLEKTLKSSLDCKEINPAYPKGNQSWVFIVWTEVETETPILWPPDVKNGLLGKDPDAGKDWRREEKGMREWDGWMSSTTRWTWVWASSRRWWWTGKAGRLQSMGSQRVGHDWATELKSDSTVPLGEPEHRNQGVVSCSSFYHNID